MTTQREIQKLVTAHRQEEGAGFIVRRPFPGPQLALMDPFLLLDEMGPIEQPAGAAKGAPDHPHRGFETVSYILEGEVEHEDSAGHHGLIGAGDVQWMTAGRGVVHSEMPSRRFQERGGRMHGFQIWVNLPRAEKMMAPRYQEVPSARMPIARSEDGRASVKVIAGEALGARAVIETRTPIVAQDWTLSPGGSVEIPLDVELEGGAYVFQGAAEIGAEGRTVRDGQLGVLTPGDRLRLASSSGARLLLLAGAPLREPVARYGPFVMSTEDELRQAFRDYQAGRMGQIER